MSRKSKCVISVSSKFLLFSYNCKFQYSGFEKFGVYSCMHGVALPEFFITLSISDHRQSLSRMKVNV